MGLHLLIKSDGARGAWWPWCMGGVIPSTILDIRSMPYPSAHVPQLLFDCEDCRQGLSIVKRDGAAPHLWYAVGLVEEPEHLPPPKLVYQPPPLTLAGVPQPEPPKPVKPKKPRPRKNRRPEIEYYLEDHLLAAIGRPTRSLAEAVRRNLVPAKFIKNAYRILDRYPYPRSPSTCLPARGEHNNPGWDNVIRAYEEDR